MQRNSKGAVHAKDIRKERALFSRGRVFFNKERLFSNKGALLLVKEWVNVRTTNHVLGVCSELTWELEGLVEK